MKDVLFTCSGLQDYETLFNAKFSARRFDKRRMKGTVRLLKNFASEELRMSKAGLQNIMTLNLGEQHVINKNAIPKIKMLYNISCLEMRFRLLCL